MQQLAQGRIIAWCGTHAGIVEYLDNLNRHGLKWAIYSGASVSLLTGSRQPTDIDIIVRDCDLDSVLALSPKGADVWHEKDAVVECGDGVILDFPKNGISFDIDSVRIEVMATGRATHNRHTYELSFTPLAMRYRLLFEVGDIDFYISSPFDTIAIKAVMQRGTEQNKFDLQDIQALYKHCQLDVTYVASRAKEINLDQRAWSFLERAQATPTTPHSACRLAPRDCL